MEFFIYTPYPIFHGLALKYRISKDFLLTYYDILEKELEIVLTAYLEKRGRV